MPLFKLYVLQTDSMLTLGQHGLSVKVLWSIAVTGLFFLPLRAQAPRIEADFLSVQDGLPANTITSLIQDHLGYIWVGTSFGLSRYDGYEFVNYIPNKEGVNNLHGDNINYIHETNQGNLWLGSNRGLHYLIEVENPFKISRLRAAPSMCIIFLKMLKEISGRFPMMKTIYIDGMWMPRLLPNFL